MPRVVVVAIGLVGGALFGAWLYLVWLMGLPPHIYIAKFFYSDVPRIEKPVRLKTGEVFTFRARMLEKRNYLLNLAVHFDRDTERSARAFVGGFYSQPRNLAIPPGTPTTFHVVISDQEQRILSDNRASFDGSSYIGAGVTGRRIDEFILDPGVYSISVTLLSEDRELTELQTSLELTSHPKATAIRN